MTVPIKSKEEYVKNLFSSIALRYDLLNTILSFKCHKRWRKFAAQKCDLENGDAALDVAAGTLDFAIELSKAVGESGHVTAIDFCLPMLDAGLSKLKKRRISNIAVVEANAEHLPFADNTFQASTIGFAMRNVASIENTILEMARVVNPGGKVVSLELAKPINPLFRMIYGFYFYKALPLIGGLFHGRLEPYQYLPESLKSFRTRDELSQIMRESGLDDIKVYNLTGGIVAVHVGTKV
ncbi:MAG: class I SAM-dependent methyltransferase [Armatimonadota bacterium]